MGSGGVGGKGGSAIVIGRLDMGSSGNGGSVIHALMAKDGSYDGS